MLTEEYHTLGLFDLVGEVMRFAITSMATKEALPRGAVEGIREGRDKARTEFPPKKKGPQLLHNFMPVKHWTIKSAYSMHHLEEVINTLITPGYRVYFLSDASNLYWAIPVKANDQKRTVFITPNGQRVDLRIGQGLKGASHTYAQFGGLVFGPLTKNSEGIGRMPTIIDRLENHAF